METSKNPDHAAAPVGAKADLRTEWSPTEGRSTSFAVRFERIGRRLDAMAERLALGDRIAAHPWRAVGIAAAAGALVGLALDRRSDAAPKRRTLTDIAVAALAGMALRQVRDLAIREAAGAARRWWVDRGHGHDDAARPLEH